MPFLAVLDEKRQIHQKQRKEIITKYPQIKHLMSPYLWSSLIIIACVATQWGIAWQLKDKPWYMIVLTAYLAGAFFNHALYVLIHEAAHNLIFKSSFMNRVFGVLCDFALAIPSAMSFRKYHLIHHQFLNHQDMDPDVPSLREANWIGNSTIKKILWLAFFSLSQALRPMKVPRQKLIDGWTLVNMLAIITLDIGLIVYIGPWFFLYLLLSTFFALGLHPLGGRWIQEHYCVMGKDQETYSYYGVLNPLILNVGYHNEHHDFPTVPWVRLPLVYSIASDYYRQLYAHHSYIKLLIRFIGDKKITPLSRQVRQEPKINFKVEDSLVLNTHE